jgi:hypothetical protein
MTLVKARVQANICFGEVRRLVAAKKISTRSAAESLITVFWDINRQLKGRDKTLFIAWFERKHAALGKELGAK